MGEPPHCNRLQCTSVTPAPSTSSKTTTKWSEATTQTLSRDSDSSIHFWGTWWGLACLVVLATYSGVIKTTTITSRSAPDLSHSNYLRAGRSLVIAPRRQFLASTTTLAPSSSPSAFSSTCNKDCCATAFPCSTATNSSAGNGWIHDIPVAVQILLIILLIVTSAMFAGLTLGLLSLDKTGLEIVMSGDNERNAHAARTIYPIRKNGNLLLCTLLFGNVAINALLSILLADKEGGLVGFLLSTFIILILGEIVPQATCSRYPLAIGSAMVPVVRLIIIMFYPVCGPLSFILNRVLKEEVATTYNQSEMLKLLQIHVQEQVLDSETAGAMTGALKYKNIPVKQVMTPLEHTFMINVDEKLSFETVATIFKTGYSRIPVYEISKNNVIGLLFVKDLIFIDPEDETPVRSFIQIFGRVVDVVWPDDKLGDVLRELKTGRSHMAIVRDVNNTDDTIDPFYEIKGIITLEDIIEEIIGDEIVDETDAYVDGSHLVKVKRGETFDWGRLRLLDSKIVDEKLSHDEARAVTAHLRTNHAHTVALLTDHQLQRFVEETSVVMLPAAVQQLGQELPADLLYERGFPTDVCTLVLAGKVTIIAGAEKFRSDVSAWSVLGGNSLTDPSYKPDFTAFVSNGPCRCLRFTREQYAMAVDASALERHALTVMPSQANNTEVVGQRSRAASETEEDAVVRQVAKGRRIKLMEAIQTAGRKEESEGANAAATNATTVNEPAIPTENANLVGPVAPSIIYGSMEENTH